MIRQLLKSSSVLGRNTKSFVQKTQFRYAGQVATQKQGSVVEQQTIDQRDLQNLALEESAVLRESNRLYFLPWQNNQKPVFEAEVPDFHVRRYTLAFGLLGASFLFMLYQGDFKYKYCLAVPLLAALVARQGARQSARRSVPYVKEILLNQDGKHVNVVVSQSRQLRNLENVPISSIRLHNGNTQEFNGLRYAGVANDGYLLNIGEDQYVAPYNHAGNKFALNNIWKGQNVDTKAI